MFVDDFDILTQQHHNIVGFLCTQYVFDLILGELLLMKLRFVKHLIPTQLTQHTQQRMQQAGVTMFACGIKVKVNRFNIAAVDG